MLEHKVMTPNKTITLHQFKKNRILVYLLIKTF